LCRDCKMMEYLEDRHCVPADHIDEEEDDGEG
jgi:hypothetical protein